MAARVQPRPFPLHPLLPFVPLQDLRPGPHVEDRSHSAPYVDGSHPELVTERYRWRQRVRRGKEEGGFTIRQAEDIADELRRHPTEIWSNYYEVVDGLQRKESA